MVTFPFAYASMQRAVSPPTIRGQPFLENLKMSIPLFVQNENHPQMQALP